MRSDSGGLAYSSEADMQILDTPFKPIRGPNLPGGTPGGGHKTTASMALSVYTLAIPIGAAWLMVQALAQNVRYTLDGTNPSAASGFQLKAGDPPRLIALAPNTINCCAPRRQAT
jgi:hypothetical protein